jgi:hypothetical protein
MSDETITLPKHDRMLEFLIDVSDDQDLLERFYPVLLQEAGQNHTIAGISRMFLVAIGQYVTRKPRSERNRMYRMVPFFIDAIVRDKKLAKEIKKSWRKLL